ncbi:MAG: TetR/AcrR family transcriptional regulator [Clostridia bacterium]|nr:TetR/AcrR family transcriptional regulator [Clostridia bacterium]
MDRRQKKTREAIFTAFTALLAQKSYHQIAVQDIIDAADIGRTTFYAHFETKDYLLKAMCEELFGHIIDTAMGLPHGHYHCSSSQKDSVFLHLLRHLRENDNHILELLSSQNNELFLRYFKGNLQELIRTQYADKDKLKSSVLPEEYLINHIASSFVETVEWWVSRKLRETPEQVTAYFLAVIEPLVLEVNQ